MTVSKRAGREIKRLSGVQVGYTLPVCGLALGPDGSQLALLDRRGSVAVLQLDTDAGHTSYQPAPTCRRRIQPRRAVSECCGVPDSIVGTEVARLVRRGKPMPVLGALVVGLIVLHLVTHLPIVGGLVAFLGLAFGLGLIVQSVRHWR